MKTALITGITGQDGFHLTKLLLQENYRVVGITSGRNSERIHHFKTLFPNTFLIEGDFGSTKVINEIILKFNPSEIYNLAAVSSVAKSFTEPELTNKINFEKVISLLDAIYLSDQNKNIRFYQSSSSEMFGDCNEERISETTQFNPLSPYGESKVKAHLYCKEFARKNKIYISEGIMFNHESEFRHQGFVSHKIIEGIISIKMGLSNRLELGDLSPKRDWGYAEDFARAMYLILQANKPDDFVIATGKSHSIYQFVEEAMKCAKLEGRVEDFVFSDTGLIRKKEIYSSTGDFSKAKKLLNWQPKYDFRSMVEILVERKLTSIRS
jgi:GDPmannose 4,6-dehydratase